MFASGNSKENRIALTFDDGPHPGYTEKILKVLDQYGIKATFFVIGQNAEYYKEALDKVIAGGHQVGSHTYSHKHIRTQSQQELERELERNRELLSSFGIVPTIFRPPEGVCNGNVYRASAKENCDIILWTVDTGDWASPPTELIVKRVTGYVKNGDIILMHDYVSGVSHTAEALEIIIPELLRQGYEFVTVNELIKGQ